MFAYNENNLARTPLHYSVHHGLLLVFAHLVSLATFMIRKQLFSMFCTEFQEHCLAVRHDVPQVILKLRGLVAAQALNLFWDNYPRCFTLFLSQSEQGELCLLCEAFLLLMLPEYPFAMG